MGINFDPKRARRPNLFVLLDKETNMYYGKGHLQSPTVQDAKQYKRKHAAIEFASLLNVSRNIPAGIGQHKNYSNRPQVVVVELDQSFEFMALHSAPPVYINLTIEDN